MGETDIITVDRLRRRYTDRRGTYDAVREVSFSVRRGELFALLGTNGAGKTSTLEVLEGLAPPSSGQVRVLGLDPYRQRRLVRSRIGIMLQDGGFPARLTVTETARFWARTLSRSRPIGEALNLVDLAHRGGVSVKQLSGGERRRLDLVLALLADPELLFLDEPTAGLDPASRTRTWTVVRDLLDRGTTVVLTTHYLEEAETLADRVAILHAGQLVRVGTPEEVTAVEPARISFTLPPGLPDRVPTLPGAVGTDRDSGGGVVIRTRDIQQTLTALLTWATTHDVRLTALEARSGSLEEAFLAVAHSTDHPTTTPTTTRERR